MALLRCRAEVDRTPEPSDGGAPISSVTAAPRSADRFDTPLDRLSNSSAPRGADRHVPNALRAA